jgi:hypothetical protein
VIPKIIWQTYKEPFHALPPYARDAVFTWQSMNPRWRWEYMSDEQAAEFVLAEYGREWHELFVGFPVGVMRGDLWRYLVVYKYGGVYADLDTVCRRPIESWLDPAWSMMVCPENEMHLCQWAFAAEPGHPLMASVLETIRQGLRSPDYSNEHFVHILTGPRAWTKGILAGLGLPMGNPVRDTPVINASPRAVETRFFCHPQFRLFHSDAILHLFGSVRWKDGRYVRWLEERNEFQSRMAKKQSG